MPETDVVIIGAGLAGLVGATRLVEAGHRVEVLEARERVGGRTVNRTLDDGTLVELGGQWIADIQPRVTDLAASLGLETYPTFGLGEHLLELEGTISRYRRGLPVPEPVVAEITRASVELDELSSRIDPESPWSGELAAELDTRTFGSWIVEACASPAARTYFRLFVQGVLATEPENVSLLHAAFYLRSGGGLARLMGTSHGAQQSRIVGGTQEMSLRLADRLGASVHLSAAARVLRWGPDGVEVEAADGATYAGRAAVVAVPPTLAGRIAYDPALPADRDLLSQRMPHGNVIKCLAVYERPFWRDDGLTGQVVSDAGPVCVAYDASAPDNEAGVLLGFLEGRHAIEAGRLDAAERRRVVLECFVRYFGDRAAEPRSYIDHDWSAEEWTRGCYGAHLPPGAWTQFGASLRAPIGPIHWAGAETATIWCGYMDGAIESGERAAGDIDRALTGAVDRG